jgi:transcriptional regulator with XRE-family HTH domain
MQFNTSSLHLAQRGRSTLLPVGARLRQLREQKGLSQGDIERRTGLLRCHISRVENGHKLPSLETLEKFASALEVPLYQIFYDGKEDVGTHRLSFRQLEGLPGGEDKRMAHTRLLKKFSGLWTRLGGPEQQILMKLARRLANVPNRIRQDP